MTKKDNEGGHRVRLAASAALPTRWGTFTIHSFTTEAGTEGPILLARGAAFRSLPAEPDKAPPPLLVRVHSECKTGDLFGSLRCDCGEQLAESMRLVGAAEEGAVIYLRQEGRGIGLHAKLHAYVLQDEGLDTVEANLRLGFPVDMRDYGEAAEILHLMGRTRVRLLTNNPDKVSGLERHGIVVVEKLPLRVASNPHSLRYLQAKRDRLGHAI